MNDLRNLRRKAGLTQAALAARSGLRQATISALENGHTRAHSSTVLALAAALDTDSDSMRAALAQSFAPDAFKADTGPIAQLARDWAFLEGLDEDLRLGLARALVAEWTHSSTAIEGNTITAGDTLFVLTEGLTISGKSLREHQELHGHAQALGLMAAWTQARQTVRVEHLHQLHRAVQTGSEIDALAPVGRWKVEPNGTTAMTTSGRTQWHDYANPAHVSALMETWLKSLALICRNPLLKPSRKRRDDPRIRDAALDGYTAAHLGFVAVHPYADGNGRLARLLANIPVLRAGLPPLLIAVEHRRDYLTLLGDYSLRRGQPRPGDDLVLTGPEHDAMREFFQSQWQGTWDLVAEYQRRRAERFGNE